jgi:hypothetical protein
VDAQSVSTAHDVAQAPPALQAKGDGQERAPCGVPTTPMHDPSLPATSHALQFPVQALPQQ